MSQAPLPPAEARRKYLIFLAVRLAGLAIMFAGVWMIRSLGQVPGLAAVLVGGASLFIRPRHLGLTGK
ncbi:MAG: hypothetical protein WCO11_10030 [Sphingomonadales bacterium]|jgi:hypothetical protein